MDAFIYIPYVNTEFDDDIFEYRGNAFDYVSKLDNAMQSIVGADNYFNNQPKRNKTAGFDSVFNKDIEDDRISYYQLPCKLFDIDENPIVIGKLLEYYKAKESFMLIFSFDSDDENISEELLIELKSWISESKKVMDMPDEFYSEDIKIGLLPKRKFKLKALNSNSILDDCTFFDLDGNKIAIFVSKIIFYN